MVEKCDWPYISGMVAVPRHQLPGRPGILQMDDMALLCRFVETGCQDSFEEIVTRHSGWVFSLSLRAVRDRHLAEDVTQAVFIVLAKKAASIRQGTPLSGWLFKASRFAVSDALKRRSRMRLRENRAGELMRHRLGAMLIDPDSPVDDEISQTLDEAVAFLSETDRQAVLLRFYEEKSLAEVGQILGISEEAAKKRVARSVAKLRKFFGRRGMIAPAALIFMLLGRRTAEAAALGEFSMATLAGGSGASIAPALADGALRLMAHAQRKLLGAILTATLAMIIAAPSLGSAVISAIEQIVGSSPPPPRLVQIPSIDSNASEPRTLKLPAEAKFADLWIGYKGQILWRSDVYQTPAISPFLLKSAEKREQPYAVAVDPHGNFFIRRLDQSILQSGPVRQALIDYDQGPIDGPSRVNSILPLIESPAEGSMAILRGPGHKATDGKPEDWHKLHRSDDPDTGTIIVEQAPARFAPIGGSMPNFEMQLGNLADVPEPTTGLFLLGGAAIVLMRRRR